MTAVVPAASLPPFLRVASAEVLAAWLTPEGPPARGAGAAAARPRAAGRQRGTSLALGMALLLSAALGWQLVLASGQGDLAAQAERLRLALGPDAPAGTLERLVDWAALRESSLAQLAPAATAPDPAAAWLRGLAAEVADGLARPEGLRALFARRCAEAAGSWSAASRADSRPPALACGGLAEAGPNGAFRRDPLAGDWRLVRLDLARLQPPDL